MSSSGWSQADASMQGREVGDVLSSPPVGTINRFEGGGKAILSLALGLWGLVIWLLPWVWVPTATMGIIWGIQGKQSINRTLGLVGTILNLVSLALGAMKAMIRSGYWG